MLEFTLLFFPTFISLMILKNREGKDYKELLFLYPIYNLGVNILSLIIVFLVKGKNLILFSQNVDSVGFCFRYLILASIIAIFIPYLKEFIIKNILFEIEIRKVKYKNDKKK